ncbi:Kinesin-like protein [Phytophthora cactorum]|nr:Kinesin-like protein [Phytophthora cactorum]
MDQTGALNSSSSEKIALSLLITRRIVCREKNGELQGIIPRVIKAVFKKLQQEVAVITSVEATTLCELNTNSEDGEGNIVIAGVKSEPADSKEAVFRHLVVGGASRVTGSTLMNEHSSRSHAIFSLLLEQRDLTSGTRRFSKFHLVDLAGSERAKRTGAVAGRFKESVSINQGLSSAWQLREPREKHQEQAIVNDRVASEEDRQRNELEMTRMREEIANLQTQLQQQTTATPPSRTPSRPSSSMGKHENHADNERELAAWSNLSISSTSRSKVLTSSRGLFTRRGGTAAYDGDEDRVVMDDDDEEARIPSAPRKSRSGAIGFSRGSSRSDSSRGSLTSGRLKTSEAIEKLETTITALQEKLEELQKKNEELLDTREESTRRWALERQNYERQLSEAEHSIEALKRDNQILEDSVLDDSRSEAKDKMRQSVGVRESISDLSKSLLVLDERMQAESKSLEELERLKKLRVRAEKKLKGLRKQEEKADFLDSEAQQELQDLEELIVDLDSHIAFQDAELKAARNDLLAIKNRSESTDAKSPLDGLANGLVQHLGLGTADAAGAAASVMSKCLDEVARLRMRVSEMGSKVQELQGLLSEREEALSQLESGLAVARHEFDRRLAAQQQASAEAMEQLKKMQPKVLVPSNNDENGETSDTHRDEEWRKLIVRCQKKDEYIADLEKHLVFYKSKAKQMQAQLQQLIGRQTEQQRRSDDGSSDSERERQLQRRIQQLEDANDALCRTWPLPKSTFELPRVEAASPEPAGSALERRSFESPEPLAPTQLEREHVHKVYDLIAPHFSHTDTIHGHK